MKRYRCPKCGYAFYGKIYECPHCNVKFHYHDDPIEVKKAPTEDTVEEPIKNEVVENEPVEKIIEEAAEQEEMKDTIIEEPAPQYEVVQQETNENKELEVDNTLPSYFDGRLIQLIGWSLLGTIVTIVTLGICYPLAYGWVAAWRTNHTVVNGYRQKFVGLPGSLIPRWILWSFLTVITFTIYGWWTPIRLQKWRVERTVLVVDDKKRS